MKPFGIVACFRRDLTQPCEFEASPVLFRSMHICIPD